MTYTVVGGVDSVIRIVKNHSGKAAPNEVCCKLKHRTLDEATGCMAELAAHLRGVGKTIELEVVDDAVAR